MQPGEESLFDQTSTRPSASANEVSALPKLYRGRAWLAALVAVLTELVVIAAVDNQGLSGKLRDPLNDPSRVFADYSRGAIDAATAFWWRFAPASGQSTHVWAAQFAAIATLVVLTWLGTLAVARGSVTFGRVWVGVWAVIAAVTPVAIMVRNVLVIPTAPGPAQSKVGQAVYGFDAFGPVIVAGVVLGLVAGLVAAAVAVSSRRQVAAAVLPAVRGSGEQDEYFDDSFAPRYGVPSTPQPYEPRPWGEESWQGAATTQLPPQPPAWPPAAPPPAPNWPPAPAQSAPPPVPPWARPDQYPTEQYALSQPQFERQPQAVAQEPQPTGPIPEVPATEPAQPAVESEQPTEQQPAVVEQPPTPQPERELADVDELADELGVEEHTQQLPTVRDEPPHT